ASRIHMPTSAHPRTLDQLLDHHRSLLYEYAKATLRESLNGEPGIDALLEVPESPEPLTQARQRIATAVREQLSAWATSGQMPPAHDAPKHARVITDKEMNR